MESVVATITGYCGEERSKLIRLINSSGGYYVGKLSKDFTTHLVCWTFEGPKYDMAKKFGIHIINHRFFEESAKQGRRVSESSYTKLSGKQVGAVLWKAPEQKLIHDKGCCLNSAGAELFREAIPDFTSRLPIDLRQTLLEDIGDFSDDDQDLKILLKHQPKWRDKRKVKASLISKSRTLGHKAGKKSGKNSSAGASLKDQNTHADNKNRVSHSMLEYVYIKDESDVEDNVNSTVLNHNSLTPGIHAGHALPDIWVSSRKPTDIWQTELFEDCNPASTREWKQKSLSDFNSMRHRKKQRLVTKGDAKSSFNGDVQGGVDVGDIPSSADVASRAEVLDEEPASLNLPLCLPFDEQLAKCPVACTLVPADIACVICHTDHISSVEGVLTCGHCFCFQCIQKWASEAALPKPTCPLCKAPFDMITKREQKIGLDDEDVSYEECVVLICRRGSSSPDQVADNTQRPACIMCGVGDTEELLLTCSGCGARSAHSFCLDPPLPAVPDTSWYCGRCSQRRRADTIWWHQLHAFEGLED